MSCSLLWYFFFGSILHDGFVGQWCVVLMYCIMMQSVIY